VSNKDSFILSLMRKKGMSLEEAEAFAEDLDIPEGAPQGQPVQVSQGAWNAGDAVQVRRGNDERAPKFVVATRGADGLTAEQARGRAMGIPLCKNCQRPEDNHLPGCARIPGVGSDARAVTKGQLPPA